jgi:hypothetical protein
MGIAHKSSLAQANEAANAARVEAARQEQERLFRLPVDQLTLGDIDRMDSNSYVRRLKTDATFGPAVDKLELTRPARPTAK